MRNFLAGKSHQPQDFEEKKDRENSEQDDMEKISHLHCNIINQTSDLLQAYMTQKIELDNSVS
jgi:hypothetical protein